MDDDIAAAAETHPKRTTSFVARLTHKNPVHYDLATRIAMERENTKYWARILLLFPLAPVCVALSTVVIGGVVINAATNKCNASLMTFMQGAVVLSYVQIWFYAYCWMGPVPIKSLRAVRVFYLLYGLVCFAWWGIYGTLQAVTATSSGFESCLSMSPTLYIMSQYEVAVFWILLLLFAGFVVNERTAALRQEKLRQWTAGKRGKKNKPKVLTPEELQDEAARASVLEAAAEKARQAEDEQRKHVQREQDHLYGDEEEGDDDAEQEGAHGFGDARLNGLGGTGGEDLGNEEEDDDEDDDGEEEIFLDGGGDDEHDASAAQAKTHVD